MCSHPRKIVNNLNPHDIERTLAMVELSLRAGNQGQAIAAINRLFGPEPKPTGDPLTWSIASLDFGAHRTRITNTLEWRGIVSVADLCRRTADDILAIPGFSWSHLTSIRAALNAHDLGLSRK